MDAATLRDRIARIKEELQQLPDMRPGTLSEQYNTCGQPGCRCKDKDAATRHGPYTQLSYTHKGRSHTEFVRKEQVADVQAQVAAYARFRALIDEWIDLSIEIARLDRPTARRNTRKE